MRPRVHAMHTPVRSTDASPAEVLADLIVGKRREQLVPEGCRVDDPDWADVHKPLVAGKIAVDTFGGHILSMYFVRIANHTASTMRDMTQGSTASGIVAAKSPMVRLALMPLFFQ